ncbi:Uncharacterized protein conserved in bacteria [uncultured Roseburia sp.]|uniref:C39 family peptidase n=1 Tax=Brotonthovivens ammoniilytica TaxID=2981725 RepID=A0ABT2TFC0_9FIRM|nr:C39 family peptidase [Brotonthovivens ammoniilytica]MCU6760883.1 C39 family peptidase [Brotonthovivens ammoniilytica]SCI12193.1 Uncharacterized protein conserved in bacteria [uncultured Roseburia sp.]
MKLINVPYLDQTCEAPTGCESVTAVMLLRYLGRQISIQEFVDEYLEKEDFKEIDGEVWGPDPYEKFAGNPYDSDSMGCYAPVICKALEKIIGDEYHVIDETGSSIEKLMETYINHDMPVVFWATINLRDMITGPDWRLFGSGKKFTWRSNEHCMLLVGYDEEHYIFNDPWENNGVIRYPKELVKDRYEKQYSQAVGLIKK